MFKCKMCGNCCREIPIDVTASDIIRWYNSGRLDILNEVSYINNYPVIGKGGFFIAKTCFNPKQPCPFLKDNKCDIHETKPFVCRNAPQAHTKFDVCSQFKKGVFNKREKLEALTKERKEFLYTYLNKDELLQLLTEVRKQCHPV